MRSLFIIVVVFVFHQKYSMHCNRSGCEYVNNEGFCDRMCQSPVGSLQSPFSSSQSVISRQYRLRTEDWQLLRQDFGDKSKFSHKLDHRRWFHTSLAAFYTEDLVTIIEIEICAVVGKDRLNLIDKLFRMGAVTHIGPEYFHHCCRFFYAPTAITRFSLYEFFHRKDS